MDCLPGLGNTSHEGSNPVSVPRTEFEIGMDTQAAYLNVDEVEYSIVCGDCGKHFWSHSKANSHAALTAHVLREDIVSPAAPVGIDMPKETEASSSEIGTTDSDEDVGDGEDEDYSICSDCGRHFWSQKAAHNHAIIGHSQDIDTVPSSAADEPPTFAAVDNAVARTPQYWNIEQTASRAVSTIPPSYNEGVDYTSPGYHRGVNPTVPVCPGGVSVTASGYRGGVSGAQAYGSNSRPSEHVLAAFQEHIARSIASNPESQSPPPEGDDTRRRSSEFSPSLSIPGLPATGSYTRSMVTSTPTISTPCTTAPPSPRSSCGTLERSQITFPSEISDRIFFIVTPSGNRKGPSSIMGLAEAQNATTFRAGVRGRLKSEGDGVSLREVVIRIPWLPVPLSVDSDEDHYHMLRLIRYWPEWQKTNGNSLCHIFASLEEEIEEKGEGMIPNKVTG